MHCATKIICLTMLVLLTGCMGVPKDAFRLSPTSLEDRQLQTREYETQNHTEIMAAAAGVLQDLGFMVDEAEKDLGVLTASKKRDARETGQMVGSFVVAALFGGPPQAVDKEQKIIVTLVVQPDMQDTKMQEVRATFQRVVWNTDNVVSRAETIKQPKIYEDFFSKLSKSVFLEAHNV